MARNKYPQETVDKILNTAMALFMEKGYERTSIQDIIDRLGGLTKGAIYYHFKSKEDIMLAIAGRMGERQEQVMGAVVRDPALTGLEKLRSMFRLSLSSMHQNELFSAAPNLLENVHILSIMLQSLIRDVAPNYICPCIEEGVRDGSIVTDYPQEVGEILILLSDFWLNPLVWPVQPGAIRRRMACYVSVVKDMGVELLDEELSRIMEDYCRLCEEKLL